MLYFHPATGTHVRIENTSTRNLRRQAPRVAMFGITNRCNLACGFCSRDTGRASAWNVSSAVEVLQDLARAGTLEVAFGGGEPLAFRGFDELVHELHRTTPLALNVTTNGTLIRAATFGTLAGRLSQVRLSIYEGTRWRSAARVLTEHGQRWGANLLVDDALLPRLPALFAELAALGCHDVSILSYVGPDPRLHLSPQGRATLAERMADSPITCRLSVCFGDSVPAPRLFDGAQGSGDCGAGLDFVSITPDQRMQGCSFHDGGLPARSAAEILHGWRSARDQLSAPSPREGCARRTGRTHAAARTPSAMPPVAVWQAFSGNNSGECVMVAKFETVADANAYLGQLLPGWTGGEVDIPPEWHRLFAAERVVAAPLPAWHETPRELLAIGRSVMAVGYDADDMLKELRALAWIKGAHVLPGGVHLHDKLQLLAAVRACDRQDAHALADQAPHPAASMFLHGDVVLALLGVQGPLEPESVEEAGGLLTAWAQQRPLAAEILFEPANDAALVEVKKHLGAELAQTPRLAVHYWGKDRDVKAARFAQLVSEGTVTVAGGCALVSGVARRKRLAVLAYRHDANVMALDGSAVTVHAYLTLPESNSAEGGRGSRQKKHEHAPPEIDAGALQGALQARMPRSTRLTIARAAWQQASTVKMRTDDPALALTVLAEVAQGLGASLQASVVEADPLALAVRRVIQDVHR